MNAFNKISLLILLGLARWTMSIDHVKNEGHMIMKRMAEAGERFEGHDVARLYFVNDQRHRRKRMAQVESDETITTARKQESSALKLELSSGSKIHLLLQPAGIVDSDTILSYQTTDEHVETKLGAITDCYFHGYINDSSGEGWAAISQCDGIFGFAGSPGYDYFLHPVGGKRSKRETDEILDVHIMWRPSSTETVNSTYTPFISGNDKDVLVPKTNKVSSQMEGSDGLRMGATEFVIETAMFTDAKYLEKLSRLYPGREEDFLLTRLAGAQSLYSNREKVGYDVQIKLKLMEYWQTNPEEYKFEEKLSSNLKSFCRYTRKKYFFDVHMLNSGVTNYNKGQVGLAYVGGACTRFRCLVSKNSGLKNFILYAHELGHTLGMAHHNSAKCPEEIKTVGGFMGGGHPLNFSPCMKYQLDRFLNKSKSNCLFKESSNSTTPVVFQNMPNVFPGQLLPPNEFCKLEAGSGYSYAPIAKSNGAPVCDWIVCLSENETSPDFGRAKRMQAPIGFPCDKESFCVNGTCNAWNDTTMSLDIETLRNLTREPEWSEWSTEFSECSRSCGTGVRSRYRECRFKNFNMAPFCPGMSRKPELCNRSPCPGDPNKLAELRKVRGNEVCSRFLKNNVQLKLRRKSSYLPTPGAVTKRDVGTNITVVQSKTCMLKCQRDPKRARGDLDAFMPDGTPCFDTQKPRYELKRFNIELKCVRGWCVEFSDCPEGLQVKDKCGVCDGDGSRCVNLEFGSDYDVPRRTRSYLTMIPAGSSHVDVNMKWKRNSGVILELWSPNRQKIIGLRGRYPKNFYVGSKAIDFAGTKWTYKRRKAFLGATGPLKQPVVIKAFRGRRPIKEISIKYTRGSPKFS